MDLKTALQELCDEVKNLLEERIKKYGVNRRTGTNTLVGSNLEKSIKVTPIENGIELQIADYWEFIARGWIRTRNYPGTMNQFVKNVDDWVRRKGIQLGNLTQSQIVWAVVKKIFDYGIHYRPFMIYDEDGDLTKMMPELNKMIDDWFENLFAAITKDLDNYFNAA